MARRRLPIRRLQHREHHDAAQVHAPAPAESEQQEADRITSDKSDSVEMPRSDRPSGRVRHDERGVAVWIGPCQR